MSRHRHDETRSADQAPMSTLADRVLDRLDPTGEGRARSRAVRAWRQVVGDEVFDHARGFALRDGELLVFVDSNAWATDLSAMSEHYRDAINILLGQETVTSMRFDASKRVRDQRAMEREQAGERAPEPTWKADPVPASELERDQVRVMAGGIRNDAIREAVIKAEIAHLEWRKGIEARNAAERALQRLRDANPSAKP